MTAAPFFMYYFFLFIADCSLQIRIYFRKKRQPSGKKQPEPAARCGRPAFFPSRSCCTTCQIYRRSCEMFRLSDNPFFRESARCQKLSTDPPSLPGQRCRRWHLRYSAVSELLPVNPAAVYRSLCLLHPWRHRWRSPRSSHKPLSA